MNSQIPNSHSMKVLIRPPAPNPPPPSPPPPIPPDPSPVQAPDSTPSQQNGVVVVGFVGRRRGDVTQLINRILDANVFGSGKLDTPFRFEKQELMTEEIEEWFKRRSISFFYEEEKEILFLQFSSISCPVMEGDLESQLGFDSVLEDHEFSDLQGLLFMFSVCHVLILTQEGSRFDIQTLKKFRMLQAAKNAMSPYFRSQVTNSHGPSSSSVFVSRASSNSPSPGRSRSILNRGASGVTVMSGLSSYSSLLPGQCYPVMLFVFLDDFSDTNPSSATGEQVESSSLNKSSSSNNTVRPNLPTKGSGSVVVLARPVNKPEGGFRKKLQSSLEAQIRFSIKKCRILSTSETGHAGTRSGGISNAAPLFVLDASKAVILVDLCSNRGGESLEFATHLVEDVIDGKATSDFLLFESNSQNANKEDILSVKEFIFRQSDILRGRGGVVSSTSSGSAAGVGMVAIAAAAAAASTASRKTISGTPELPSLGTWLSSSQPILHGILSAKQGYIGDSEFNKRKPEQQNAVMPAVEGNASKATDSFEKAISILESGRGLCAKFSTSWCEKSLPIAKEIYLNELPPCYPTSQHEAHLERSLEAFKSMVKGPAVQIYMEKLKNECTSIWSSGRQLCDAVSLTGKPCMHKRHGVGTDDLLSTDEIKPHSSGFVFLHACACGRSRQLRSDPFDFETANTFNCFPECDKLLPALHFPQGSTERPIKPSCWSLIRVGGARYYNPAKGLLQSGFGTTQKFLLKWSIVVGEQNMSNGLSLSDQPQIYSKNLSASNKDEPLGGKDTEKVGDVQFQAPELQSEVEVRRRQPLLNTKTSDKNMGVFSSTMRKPFSEVVAGSAGRQSGFPPLQTRKPPLTGAEKSTKQHDAKEKGLSKVMETANNQWSQKLPDTTDHATDVVANNPNAGRGSDSLLQRGGNEVPTSKAPGGKVREFTSLKHVSVYVGFEHECPHGHRFILRPDHLKDLGSPYAMPEESLVTSSIQNSDHDVEDPIRSGKNSGHGRARRQSNGSNNNVLRTTRKEESKVRSTNRSVYENGRMQVSSISSKQQTGEAKVTSSVMDLAAGFQSVSLDDGGAAFSLLNRSLPIYMNCPHCRDSGKNKDTTNVKFAGTISQLQRIFLVTPAFPVILAACPIVQFEDSCLPSTVSDRKEKLQFGLGCRVILPPDSFLSLRLPFVYGVQLDDGKVYPLTPFEDLPQLTAWITKGTMLQVVSQGSNLDEGSCM